MSNTIRIGVIGFGYWGPNVVRNLLALESAHLVGVCDQDPSALRRVKQAYPSVEVFADSVEFLALSQMDAVAIVTPVWTHYALAKTALQNGKHIFVEKPFTTTVDQAEELIELADRKNLKIMVDHTFLFTGSVRKIRQFVDEGLLGSLYYYDAMRVNLGLFQHDVSVLWDLAPHDLSIMDYLIRETPEAVVATGQKHLNGHEDVAFLTLYFSNKVVAHINVSWLSPVKVRTTLIAGEKKMLVWNDLEADEKLKIYDRGVQVTGSNMNEIAVSYRSGDMWAPKLDQTEALKTELSYFVDCVMNHRSPHNDGHAGLRVVRILEAADRSLRENGRGIELLANSATMAAAR